MRRYGKTSDATVVPGKDAGIKLVLQPLADAAKYAEIAPCEPSVTGLFWFSDSTGLFDQDSEAAYILAEGAAGPLLGVAKLVGEPCDLPVTWTKEWEQTTGTGGDPGYLEDGASLIVYPLATTVPGILSVTAEHGGTSYGPILLTVLKYSCYCYGSGGTAQSLAWRDFQTVFDGTGALGISWTANPKHVDQDGSPFTVNLAIKSGFALPDPCNVRATFEPDAGQPTTWDIQFKFGSATSYYLVSTDATPHSWSVAGASFLQLYGYFPHIESIGNLSIEIECYGP